MGLTPDMVPAELRQQIYAQLGITASGGEAEEAPAAEKPALRDAKTLKKIEEKRSKKREQARSDREEQGKLASLKESDLLHSTEGIGGNERITMSDILGSIDADKFAATGQESNAAAAASKKKDASGSTINTGKLRK